MKKKLILLQFFCFVSILFISAAFAVFNSELKITGEVSVLTDTTAPTCGEWKLRDSNLSYEDARNNNSFINPGTNTTWRNTSLTLSVDCNDNMSGAFGCTRDYFDAKTYNTSIKTDDEVITVEIKDAYNNRTTCTLPIGGSNPYIDNQEPIISINREDYNTFSFTLTDEFGLIGYAITNSPNEPSDFTEVENLNSVTGTYDIDSSEAKTYYIWVKDSANVTMRSISSYLVTRSEGKGTKLITRIDGTNSHDGIDLTNNTVVLDNTPIYTLGIIQTGYNNLEVKQNNDALNIYGEEVLISGTTTLSSSATSKTHVVSFDGNGANVNASPKIVLYGNEYGELPTPTKEGYAFKGWSLLPDNYVQLDYIESNGTQYIDTGVSENNIYGLTFKYIPTGVSNNYESYLSGTRDNFTLGRYVSINHAYVRYRTSEITHTLNVDSNNINTLTIQNDIVNGNSDAFYADTSLPISTGGSDLMIANNASLTRYSSLKIYALILYDQNGDVIRNFIPCKRVTDNAVGMFDLVNNVFYGSSGSGSFLAGNEISNSYITPTSIVSIDDDHTLRAHWSIQLLFNPSQGNVDPTSKLIAYNLPYGQLPTPTKTNYFFDGWTLNEEYQELEFIESTGTQYINTNYFVTANTGVEVDYRFQQSSLQQRIYGVEGDVYYQLYINGAGAWAYAYNDSSGNWVSSSVASNLKKHNLKFNVTHGKILIDDGSTYSANISGTVTKTANYPLYLFVNNGSGTVNCVGSSRIYSFKIYENGTLVRNFVPARRLSDNAIGMIEKVNNIFYENAGTGKFIAGQEKEDNIITSASIVSKNYTHTAFARWESPYTLTINPNGGTYESSTSPVTKTLRYSEVYNITNPTKSGNTFLGWKELSDSVSSTGLSGIAVYNNNGNGVVTLTSTSKSSDNPLTLTSNEYLLSNSGTAATKPSLGGFNQTKATEPNHVYVHVIVAKLPKGYYFHEAYNSIGTGYHIEWLTSQKGTGKWQTYIYKVKSGSSGSFSTLGFVYVSKSALNDWQAYVSETGAYSANIAYSNIFDITSDNTGIGQLDGTGVLTARWGTTLTVKPNGGNFNGSTSNTTYTQDINSLQVLPAPTRSCYTFNGWTNSSTANGTVTKYGNPLFTDDTFVSSVNSMGVYNNKQNGTVTHSRVATTSDNPLKKSSYVMKITTNGEASPGLGGFVQYTQSSANAVFYHVIVAKIPKGYTIQHAENQTGNDRVITWLTSQAGTGKYEVYIYKHKCGSTGTFSSFGHVYISGTLATSTNPVTWYVAFANMFNASSTPNNSSQVYTYGNANNTITANWTPNVYTITLNNQSATSAGTTAIYEKYATGYYTNSGTTTQMTASANKITVPSRTGYTFGGYYTSTNGGGTQYINASGYITSAASTSHFCGAGTLYAKWTVNNYTVKVTPKVDGTTYASGGAYNNGYFTFNVYKAGTLVSSGVNSYSASIPYGTSVRVVAVAHNGFRITANGDVTATVGTSGLTFTPTWTHSTASITYRSAVMGSGAFQSSVTGPALSGTTGQSKTIDQFQVTGFTISNSTTSGSVNWRLHQQDRGDMPSSSSYYVYPGTTVDTGGKRIEGITMKLTGDASNYFDIYYRVHVQDQGWLNWTSDNAFTGSQGLCKRVEAVKVKVVPKGTSVTLNECGSGETCKDTSVITSDTASNCPVDDGSGGNSGGGSSSSTCTKTSYKNYSASVDGPSNAETQCRTYAKAHLHTAYGVKGTLNSSRVTYCSSGYCTCTWKEKYTYKSSC